MPMRTAVRCARLGRPSPTRPTHTQEPAKKWSRSHASTASSVYAPRGSICPRPARVEHGSRPRRAGAAVAVFDSPRLPRHGDRRLESVELAVGEDALAVRGSAGMPVTPPPRVRRRRALVQALDRRRVVGVAGRRTHVEQLLGRELAVEDVAADQAVVLLHLVRADHLAVDDRLLEVRRELVVAVDDPVGVRLELLGVRLLGPGVTAPTA